MKFVFCSQIIQPFDNLNVNNNAQYVAQQPIVQQPTTPQPNLQQQLYPQLPPMPELPSNASTNSQNRRPQAVRNLQYSQRSQQIPTILQSGSITIDSFRLLSVLGRGHFGKVILSQYKKTGNNFGNIEVKFFS